jgi:hypothetical protein
VRFEPKKSRVNPYWIVGATFATILVTALVLETLFLNGEDKTKALIITPVIMVLFGGFTCLGFWLDKSTQHRNQDNIKH